MPETVKLRCKVTDAAGEVIYCENARYYSKDLAFTTMPPAQIKTQVGDTITIPMAVEGGYPRYHIEIKYDYTVIEDTYDGTLPEFVVRESYFDKTLYYEVTDSAGNEITSGDIKLVNDPLRILAQPEDAPAREGDTVYFTVEAGGGEGPYTYQWQYNTVSMGTNWFDVKEDNVHLVTNGNTKKLSVGVTAIKFTLKYKFRCIITDEAGNQVISDAATLTERTTSLLMITSQPQNVTATVGDTVSFNVGVGGGKYPYTLQWQQSSYGSGWSNIPNQTGFKYSFTVTDEREFDDEYRYRCVITDADGETVVSDVVYVEEALRITTQPKSQTGKNGDTLSYTVGVSGGSGSYTYQWYYKILSGQWIESTVKSPTYKFDVNEITVLQTYSFYCVITDTNGNQVTTNTVTFKPA